MANLRWLALATATAAGSISALHAQPVYSAKAAAAAMARINTWGHPDQFYEGGGMQAYVAHQYVQAMNDFKRAAFYADKLSQLSIGLMYLNGEGVARDPVTAYAWISLAAERNYPTFVATRDNVGKQLSPAQREQAIAMLPELVGQYGDAVAKPRMVRELRSAMHVAGSTGQPPAGTRTYLGGAADRLSSCGPFGGRGDCSMYASWRWDPDQYFAARDAQWQAPVVGKVTVLPIQSATTPPRQKQPAH
jgi:hypothetical protein